MLGFSLAALVGVLLVVVTVAWMLWRTSIVAEEIHVGELARDLGQRTEQILIDARQTLERLDQFPDERCSAGHLAAMRDAAVSRAYIRTIGYWQAAERLCGVGFVESSGLRPARADRIYDSGMIAWWPSPQTEVGGVRLFLMRYGDHDIAIDPAMLLETGPMRDRHAELWLEGLRLAGSGVDLDLPAPGLIAPGLTIDRENGRVISRYSRDSVFPIDIVAVEPLERFWGRHLLGVAVVIALGLVLIVAWLLVILRYSRHRMSLSTQLREAIAEGRISVHYQPVMDLVTGMCVGAEALARWQVEDGEWISPEVFIPVAERSGLIGRITLAVLDCIVRDLGHLLRDGSGFSVNLNLASEDLLGAKFVRALTTRLDAAAVPAGRVKLEITERALIDEEASRQVLAELRRRGHPLVVDDFGTGYSSLSYLERLELDALKIDKSFVDGIGTGAVTGGVVGHIIEMADSLGLEAVAEGIENTEQLNWLLSHGVRYGQGFHFSPGLPAGRLLEFLALNSGQTGPFSDASVSAQAG